MCALIFVQCPFIIRQINLKVHYLAECSLDTVYSHNNTCIFLNFPLGSLKFNSTLLYSTLLFRTHCEAPHVIGTGGWRFSTGKAEQRRGRAPPVPREFRTLERGPGRTQGTGMHTPAAHSLRSCSALKRGKAAGVRESRQRERHTTTWW